MSATDSSASCWRKKREEDESRRIEKTKRQIGFHARNAEREDLLFLCGSRAGAELERHLLLARSSFRVLGNR
ncbi:unnamed protein product [Victoria cruziana]